MADMFFSLKETAEKLGKTEQQVKELIKTGKLREFRDGSHLLFKIDEVEQLMTELTAGQTEPSQEPSAESAEQTTEEPQAKRAEELIPELRSSEPAPDTEPQEPQESAPQKDTSSSDEPQAELELEIEPEAELELEPEAKSEPETEAELELAEESPEKTAGSESELEEVLGLDDTVAAQNTESSEFDLLLDETTANKAGASTTESSEFDLSLDETGDDEDLLLSSGSEDRLLSTGSVNISDDQLTNMDTDLTGEGINVLGDDQSGYKISDDTGAETTLPPMDSVEPSLQEIEDDVNLDSFGSGSGLLDLSLQADDTSLGGILDEIYTTDGEPEGQESTEAATVDEMITEADHAVEQQHAEPDAMLQAPIIRTAAAQFYDPKSDKLGLVIFLPLLAILYSIIVTAATATMRGKAPIILTSLQSFIWYIVGGAALVVAIFGIWAMIPAGDAVKKPKKAKQKKGKKVKEKKAKAPKEKKPKKSGGLFKRKK